MNRQIILFDMDGTLVNSKKDLADSINAVRIGKKLPPLGEEEIFAVLGSVDANLAWHLYQTPTYEPADRKVFEEHYSRACLENSKLFDGVLQSLAYLKARGVLMSVATNAPTRFAKKILFYLGIGHFFDYIVGACDVKMPKPQPDIILKILESYGHNRQQPPPLMIGDTPKDIEAAKRASTVPILAAWGFGGEIPGKIRILQNPHDLRRLIE